MKREYPKLLNKPFPEIIREKNLVLTPSALLAARYIHSSDIYERSQIIIYDNYTTIDNNPKLAKLIENTNLAGQNSLQHEVHHHYNSLVDENYIIEERQMAQIIDYRYRIEINNELTSLMDGYLSLNENPLELDNFCLSPCMPYLGNFKHINLKEKANELFICAAMEISMGNTFRILTIL